MARMGAVAWLVMGTLGMMGATGLARDRDQDGVVPDAPPPEANDVQVEVPRGGPVYITLSAYSLTSPVLRYRIRVAPKAGKVGTPEVVTVDTGRVKYTPPAGVGPGEDAFSYQVQSEAGVSAAAVVTIKITDRDPQVITPDELDFGQVLPGQTVKRVLTMENIGGGLAQGNVQVPDGWSVEGDGAYKLLAGAKQSFTVVFKPAEVRDYIGDVEYTGNLERATDLKGKVVAPVEATTKSVELSAAGNVRMGTIHIENRTDGDKRLKLTAGPLLTVDENVDVPAKGGADIVVAAKDDGKGGAQAIDENVKIEGEGIDATVEVYGAAAPVAATPAPMVRQAPPPVEPRAAAIQAQMAANEDALMRELLLPQEGPDLSGLMTLAQEMPVATLQMDPGESGRAPRVGSDFSGMPQAQAYRLEAQSVTVNAQGTPEPVWLPMHNVSYDVNGQKVAVELTRLRRNALYVLRLVGIDGQGNIIETTAPREMWTVEEKGGGYWKWALLAGVAALMALGMVAVWRWWQGPMWG
jgi:hypothetical protein